MNHSFNHFLQSLFLPIDERFFFKQSAQYIELQLHHYLKNQGVVVKHFSQAIKAGRKLKDSETNKRFWLALVEFNNCIKNSQCKRASSNIKWLKFVNIIEQLQGYRGHQLFAGEKIKIKQKYRLYLAYMLTWEHLRYLAGEDDEFSPSTEILNRLATTYEHQHEHKE